MKRTLRRGAVAVIILLIAFGLYAARLVRSLDTPEFKARAAREASTVMGSRVELGSLDVSLLRGIRLGGIRVRNPRGFAGDLLNYSMDWIFLFTITGLAIVGILLGNALSHRMSSLKLRKLFGWFILVMGIWILAREILQS